MTPYMRLELSRSARGSSLWERKVHALGTSTERMSRFWSLLRDDLEPKVAASLIVMDPEPIQNTR